MKKSQWMVYMTILFCFILCSNQAPAQADVVAAIKCASPSQAAPGQKLGKTISVWVRNQGNATAAKVVIDLFLSTDRTAADKHKVYKANFEEDVLLQGGREQIQNLAPGQTVKVTMHGWNKIPADTPPGNYYIGVLADPHNLNNEPTATRRNNMAFCGIRIGRIARYRVTRVWATVTPKSKVGPCPHRFIFTGYVRTNGPCTVKYQWKRNDNATAPVKTLIFRKAGTQKVTTWWQLGGAGKTYAKYWQALAILAPNKMMSNKAYFNLRCTSGGGQTGRKLPDLIVSDIAVVQGCKVKITLKNIGTAGVPAAKYNLPKAVGVQTYKNGKPWGGIILSGFDKAGKLKVPGGTASWILFPASKTLPAGTSSIKVVVDHLKNLVELKENNNTRTERLTCGSGQSGRKLPDLIVSDIAVVQGCKVKITLKNIGTAGVPAAKYNLPKAVGVQTYKNGKPWGGIILSGFDKAGKLKVPGGTASWILFPASKTLPAGTSSIKVVVDHLKNLVELKENNNTRTERLTCGSGGTPSYANKPCGVRLNSLSKTSGYPGDTFRLIGTWGATKGPKLPCINKGKMNKLIVLGWSNTAIRVKIPAGLAPGTYKVGVYCHSLDLGRTYSSGWMDFEVKARGGSTAPSRTFQVIHPTNSQDFALTNNKVVIRVRFNRPVNRSTVILRRTFIVKMETTANAQGTLRWINSREVEFTSTRDYGQLCRFDSDCIFYLRISSAVKDTGGNALDGDKNGVAGGNYEHQFIIVG